ncbi:MAG: T9SS type A sorting domain-containing protein [Ignavibacteria bacterium]|nr:T9SS type A sorting domain-containing protein [Ignavibacteria bacterium]
MKLIILVLMICLFTNYISAQQLIWKHTGGPMGGIVGDIAINSLGEIYAGVYPFDIEYSGLYKSTDNGDDWFKVETQFEDFEVYAIYITKEDHIWIGTNFQGRIYRSTDNGVTWENKRNGYNTGECWAFGQSKEGVMFAGDGQYIQLYRSTDYGENWEFSANLRPLVFATDSNNIVYAGTHDGLFATTDNGLTWAQNNFLSNIPVSSILIDSNNNIYCGTGYYNNGNGVFYSNDGGQTWAQLGLAGKIVLSLAFDSQGNLYAGTKEDGLYKTTDLGQTWEQYNKGLYRKEVFRLKLNKQNDIFIGSENEGVFRSTNNGESFEHIGLPISSIENIVIIDDSLIFCATPSGIQKYNRINNKWENKGLQKIYSVAKNENNYLFVGTFDEGLLYTTNLGENWVQTSLTPDSLLTIWNVASTNTYIFAQTERNFRISSDLGTTWEIFPFRSWWRTSGMFLNEDTLYFTSIFSSLNHSLRRSFSNFTTFDSLLSGFSMVGLNGIWVHNNYIFLADGMSSGGIYKSFDFGLTWSKIINNKNMRTIFVSKNNKLLAAGIDSLYYSSNFGNTMHIIESPLKPNNYVNEIEEDRNGKIFFGTYNEGLFEVDILASVQETSSIVNNYKLNQNYPNPFNPVTNIKFSIPKSDVVKIKVYDILGKEIQTLLNEYKTTGRYEVEFNASNLPSGIYFYRMVSGNYSEAKKMILLR